MKICTSQADRNFWRYTESGGETELTGGGTVLGVAAVQEEALGGALMGGERLEDKSGEREVSATGERAEQTFFQAIVMDHF